MATLIWPSINRQAAASCAQLIPMTTGLLFVIVFSLVYLSACVTRQAGTRLRRNGLSHRAKPPGAVVKRALSFSRANDCRIDLLLGSAEVVFIIDFGP